MFQSYMRTVCLQSAMLRLSGSFSGKGMPLSTLGTILKDNWIWREQIWELAVFELKKRSSGAALGWVWFFVQPILYIFCFWFGISIGLRAERSISSEAPFILWLASGVIPWFFMRNMLNTGVDVFHHYSYLVKKVKFPLSAISTVYTTATMLLQLMLQTILVVVYFLCGYGLDLYLLQVPVILALMFVFWDAFSVLMSPICGMSKDIKNLVSALTTPLFWLSGIIFDMGLRSSGNEIIQAILYFNPITFFATAFRDALCDKIWLWEDPQRCACFCIVFFFTIAFAVVSYKKTNKVVADVL